MAERDAKRGLSGGQAGKRVTSKKVKGTRPAPPPPEAPAALPINLPTAMFSAPGLLTLADLVPVMTAFVDRDLRYRFINKALAEWFERPRQEMLGRSMAEVIGEENYAHRKGLVEAAMAGERKENVLIQI